MDATLVEPERRLLLVLSMRGKEGRAGRNLASADEGLAMNSHSPPSPNTVRVPVCLSPTCSGPGNILRGILAVC
jgi:hypothetical protein